MSEDPPEGVLEALRNAVGARGWVADAAGMEPHLVEERGRYRGRCSAVLRPGTTGEVSEIVRICADAGISMVVQGGNTGLVGGGVPDGGVVISTARLNRIRSIDPINLAITVEAGCVLADVQEAALESGCLFPLSLAAEGSCQIGGNLSTNAGGVAVLRYGNARDLVLGLEVVLADGSVWEGLRGLRKDNTGYDLKHLFIGAEGTLGIITAAVLKLFPLPRVRETALAAMASPEAALKLFVITRGVCGDMLTAFELFSRRCLEFVLAHVPGTVDPMDAPHPYYALVELSGSQPGAALRETMEGVLATALEDTIIGDAVMAASQTQTDQLWRLRETIPEAEKREGVAIKHDISVPVSRIPEFIAEAEKAVEREVPGARIVIFGHIGDGNLHYNLCQPAGADPEAFKAREKDLNRLVHDLACRMEGSFSAEHGIGQLKLDELRRYKPAVEVDVMRRLKRALDPAGIMNPGKVVSGGPG